MLSYSLNRSLKIFDKNSGLEISSIFIQLIKSLNSLDLNRKSSYEEFKEIFTSKVSMMYKSTPHVLKSEIEDKFYTQDDIKYLLKYLIVDEFAKKVVAIDDNNNITMIKKEYVDPFAPPFEDGRVIEEDFGNFMTHRIFFSKFAVMEEHLLLVTREFISQYTHLSFEDIRNTILLMSIMNGVVFFNGGKMAGASQPRKHLQCIPFKSMYNKEFGIFQLINNKENLESISDGIFIENQQMEELNPFLKFHKIRKFSDASINHIFVKYSQELSNLLNSSLNEDTLPILSDLIFNVYNIGLNYLNLIDNEEQITKNYSVLITTEWLLIVPRKAHDVYLNKGMLNINSIGFLLTMLVKNEELGEELKTKNILKEVFAEL